MRSTDGRDWKKIDVAQRDGIFVGVAMKGNVGLLLAARSASTTRPMTGSLEDGFQPRRTESKGESRRDGASPRRWDANVLVLDVECLVHAGARKSRKKYVLVQGAARARDGRKDGRCRSERCRRAKPTSRRFEIGQAPREEDRRARRMRSRAAAVRGKSILLAAMPWKHRDRDQQDKSPLYTLLRNRPTPGVDGGKETA